MHESAFPRQVTSQEADVLRAIISRAPCAECLVLESYRIDELEVSARCECGCDSVFFGSYDASNIPSIIADGLGYSDAGEEMNIILWANEDRIVHLELVAHTVAPARLPVPASVCSFENQVRK